MESKQPHHLVRAVAHRWKLNEYFSQQISCSHDMMSGFSPLFLQETSGACMFCNGATHLRFQCSLSFLVMFSNQRKCLTEDEVLDILYNDDSGDDLIPELDSNSDSESDNEAYRTDIILVIVLLFSIFRKSRSKYSIRK